jgi:hypothetical protein
MKSNLKYVGFSAALILAETDLAGLHVLDEGRVLLLVVCGFSRQQHV